MKEGGRGIERESGTGREGTGRGRRRREGGGGREKGGEKEGGRRRRREKEGGGREGRARERRLGGKFLHLGRRSWKKA